MIEGSSLSIPQQRSPFDSLRHVDDNGEFWVARELMPLMGYTKWERFADAINRAKAACFNSGQAADLHFSRLREEASAGRPRINYRLTRYGAYLVAMNGDPTKPEIAAAQTYFAVKAREAEEVQAGDDLDVIESMVRAIRADRVRLAAVEAGQREQAERQRQIEARLDGIEGLHNWYSALGYAKIKGLPTDPGYLQRLGRAAGRITRRDGAEPGRAPHALYGQVNTYPETALDEAAASMASRPAPASRPSQRQDSRRPRR